MTCRGNLAGLPQSQPNKLSTLRTLSAKSCLLADKPSLESS